MRLSAAAVDGWATGTIGRTARIIARKCPGVKHLLQTAQRRTCDSDNPNTFSSLLTSTGQMALGGRMATGVKATAASSASRSVLE